MNGVILCVGKLREKWQQQGCAEYLKRLSRYGKYEVVAVDDLPAPEKASEAQIRQVMEKDGQALLRHIRPSDRVGHDVLEPFEPHEGLRGDGLGRHVVVEGVNPAVQGIIGHQRHKDQKREDVQKLHVRPGLFAHPVTPFHDTGVSPVSV